MSHLFTVAGSTPVVLNEIAHKLREKISALPPDAPQLAEQPLSTQTGVLVALAVVRGNETPHTHPKSDLVFTVLEGGGYVQLSDGIVGAPPQTTVVIPKGVCHAYYNTAEPDSVLLATFSPALPAHGECAKSGSAPSQHNRL
ncbi:MAG: Cupin [Acidobacteriota bacterium]|jgi:quercetin dioxygenase-like cupin family protein|nr:Cupin [Acidobacteriota bacterium]